MSPAGRWSCLEGVTEDGKQAAKGPKNAQAANDKEACGAQAAPCPLSLQGHSPLRRCNAKILNF